GALLRRDRLRDCAVEADRLAALLLVMFADEIEEGGLDVVAKAALVGIGVAELPLHETEGELLRQFAGQVRIAHGGDEVTIDRAAVALQEHLPRRRRRLRRLRAV